MSFVCILGLLSCVICYLVYFFELNVCLLFFKKTYCEGI